MSKFVSEITSISFAITGSYMAANGINGWGWFIFAAVLTTSTFNFKDDKDGDKK